MDTKISPDTLTKAAVRAAERLDLHGTLPAILGISTAETADLREGRRLLTTDSAEWSAAGDLVSLYRALITLLPTITDAVNWLRSPHATLGAAPIDLLPTTEGRERLLRYLDAVQKYEIKLMR